jgi:hypothetical protein
MLRRGGRLDVRDCTTAAHRGSRVVNASTLTVQPGAGLQPDCVSAAAPRGGNDIASSAVGPVPVAEILRRRRGLFDANSPQAELTHLASTYYGHPSLVLERAR